jgi:pimeloyl-ACP methyl ester carboxylesterase
MRALIKKTTLIKLMVSVLGIIVIMMGGGFYVSDMIKDGVLAPKRGNRPFDLKVINVGEGRVTLQTTTKTVNDDWRKDGIWGIRWSGGCAQISEILRSSNQHVIRKFIPLTGNLKCGDMVRVDACAFPDDPHEAFGVPIQKVSFSSPLSTFPAYFINGSHNTWFIFVHGKRDYPPRGPIRAYPIIPLITELGLPSLIITYRNDIGVTASSDGFHWYGLTEWKDLEGAIKYAMDNGAEDIILVGYSMGGAIVMNFMYQSGLARKVRGIILDAPMLDLNATIDHGAEQLHLPNFITSLSKFIARLRFNIDWKKLNYLNYVDKLTVPVLLFHGDDDTTIPFETSEALANTRPDIVKYYRVHGATHIRSWNMNPSKYEDAVRDFLGRVLSTKR